MEKLFNIIQNSINTLRDDISRLSDKYAESNRLIWIKITELEGRLNGLIEDEKRKRSHWRWIIPVIISSLALLVTIHELLSKH